MTLVFNPAAFKHKVSERDIESAMATAIFDEIIEGYNNKYLLIGNEGSSGNIVEN